MLGAGRLDLFSGCALSVSSVSSKRHWEPNISNKRRNGNFPETLSTCLKLVSQVVLGATATTERPRINTPARQELQDKDEPPPSLSGEK